MTERRVLTKVAKPTTPGDGLKRDVGLLGLLWISEGSIIGSGWLFGALTATTIAGPSALLAWGIGSVIVLVLALVHAELGAMFPVSGGTSRFPHYAFGSVAGGAFGWFSYIQVATVAPIEVEATIQYLSSTSWAHGLWNANKGTLSHSGLVVGVGLMLVFTALNLLGVRLLSRVNSAITVVKVLIPLLFVIVMLSTHFHGGNFTAGGGFFVKGSEVKSILIALASGGVVFGLLGFEQAVQLAGESRNPKRDVSRAVIGSIILGAAIYITVQVAFIAALSPRLLAQAATWSALGTANSSNPQLAALQASPLYTVATLASLGWLAAILRFDAVVSPGGTGLICLTASSRISYGLSKNGYVPTTFEKKNRFAIPARGVVIATIIGLLFLLPFPSWASLVGVITSASVIMYAAAPLALGALRKTKADLPRPYCMPGSAVLAPASFVSANWIIYWAGWAVYSTLMITLLLGLALMAVSYIFHLNPNRPTLDWAAGVWLLPYFAGMGLICYLGGFGAGAPFNGYYGFAGILVGGKGHLGLYWDLLVVAIFSLVIYYLALRNRLPSEKVDEYVQHGCDTAAG